MYAPSRMKEKDREKGRERGKMERKSERVAMKAYKLLPEDG